MERKSNVGRTYDETGKCIKNHHYTETHHPDGYVYLGSTCKTHVVIVTPHAKGLKVYSSAQLYARRSGGATKLGRASKTYIVPGQYTLEDFAKWIHYITGDSPTQNDKTFSFANGHDASTSVRRRITHIKHVMKDSGMWGKRGRLAWNDVPTDFFKAISISDFILGGTQSYHTWWKRYLARIVPAIDDERVTFLQQASQQLGIPIPNPELATPSVLAIHQRAYFLRLKYTGTLIADGIYPKAPHTITGWGKVPLKYMVKNYRDVVSTPIWATFVRDVLPRFSFSCLMKNGVDTVLYSNVTAKLPGVVDYLLRLDPNMDTTTALSAFREHISTDFILRMNLTNQTDLAVLVDSTKAYEQANGVHRNRRITKAYRPPTVLLSPGWKFVTYDTFTNKLKRKHSVYDYAVTQQIADGLCHIVYHHDLECGDALAVLRYGLTENGDTSKWHVVHWSPTMDEMNRRFAMAITGIVNRMNAQYPGPSPKIPQVYRDAILWKAMRLSPLATFICTEYHKTYNNGDNKNNLRPLPLEPTHPAYADPEAIIERHLQSLHADPAAHQDKTLADTCDECPF